MIKEIVLKLVPIPMVENMKVVDLINEDPIIDPKEYPYMHRANHVLKETICKYPKVYLEEGASGNLIPVERKVGKFLSRFVKPVYEVKIHGKRNYKVLEDIAYRNPKESNLEIVLQTSIPDFQNVEHMIYLEGNMKFDFEKGYVSITDSEDFFWEALRRRKSLKKELWQIE